MGEGAFDDAEVALFWRYIVSSLDRLVAVGAELPVTGLHWAPPAPATNSVAVLIRHTLGNAEENLLGVVCGETIVRDRAGEFVAPAVDGATLAAEWAVARARLATALAALPAGTPDEPRRHPRRGELTARDVLIVVARHSAEHLGQAELTRDLWRATVAGDGQPG